MSPADRSGTGGPALATRLIAAGDALAAVAAGLDPEQWRRIAVNSPDIVQGRDEDRPAGVVVHHVAAWLPRLWGMVEQAAGGSSSARVDPAEIDRVNASHAREHPDPDQAETVSLLRDRTAEVAAALAGLSDEELARGPAEGMSAGALAQRLLIGHITWHLGSIRATFRTAEPAPQ